MSVDPLPSTKVKTYSLPIYQAAISGRIIFKRKIKTQEGSLFLTVLKLPAPDAFSHPAQVEVRSRQTIGNPGDDVTGNVTISGFPNSFDTKPDGNGEILRVVSANNHLVWVEE